MKTLLYILVISSLFFGCKKYPEDEVFVHLKKPIKRLYHHSLYINEYKVDGVDSTSYVNSKLSSGFTLENIEIIYDNLAEGIARIVPGGRLGIAFVDGNNYVLVGQEISNIGLSYPIFFQGQNKWKIMRLDKDKFIIELIKNNKTYRIGFKII